MVALDGTEAEAWERANRIVLGPRVRGNALLALVRGARRDVGPAGVAATSALASAPVSRRSLEFVVDALLAVVADASLSAERRGLAAEGVGNHLEFSKRRRLVRRASLQLVDHLRDPVAEVRFWSAFSLGKLRARRARKHLSVLSADVSVVPGWWSVGKEAADALAMINGEDRPEDDANEPADITPGDQPDPFGDASHNRVR